MTIDAEMLQLGDLRHVGMALLEFARSLSAGEFVKTGSAWIYRPNNFVGFEIRYRRVKKLNVLARPIRVPDEPVDCSAGGSGSAVRDANLLRT